MTDHFAFDIAPNAEFADRLEADLLRTIGKHASSPTTGTIDVRDSEEHLMTIDTEPPPVWTRPRTIAAVAAAAAAVIVVVASLVWATNRSTDDEVTGSSANVTFTVMWAYSDIVHECSPGSRSVCLNRFDIPAAAEFSGAIAGSGSQVVLWNDPVDYPDQEVDHLEHVVTYNVDALVDGCGRGQFLLVEIMQFVSGANRDRDSGTYIGTWQIVAQSGRSGLESITGSGSSTGSFGTAVDIGRSFTGTISCP
jgi:hypothetical protein